MARKVVKDIKTTRSDGQTFSTRIESTYHDSRSSSVHRAFSRVKVGISSLTWIMLFIAFFRFVGVSLGFPDPLFISYASQTAGDVPADLFYFDIFAFLRNVAVALDDWGGQLTSIVQIADIPVDSVGNQAFTWLNFMIYFLNVNISLFRFVVGWPFEILNVIFGSFFSYLFGGPDGWLHVVMDWNIPYVDMTAFGGWIYEVAVTALSWILEQIQVFFWPLFHMWPWG